MDRVAAGPAIQSSACEVACQSPEEAADAQTRATAVKSSSYDMAVKAIESRRHYNPGQHEEGEVSEGSRREGSAGRSQYQNKPARDPLCEASVTDSGCIDCLPNEVLIHVLQFLDVSDLLATSRTSHLLRSLSLSPILHHDRLRRARQTLPPLLSSPGRPTLADLISRSIVLSHTSVVSRRLARSLVSIRLSRRLALRPSAEALVERCVLPKECVPGMGTVHVAPALVAKRKAIEKAQVKDGLRRWIAAKWKGEVREREEELKRWHESRGIGRVWKLTKFWERVSRGDCLPLR